MPIMMRSTKANRLMTPAENIARDRSDYFKGDREDMRRFLPDNIRSILDIGCAAGNFLGTLDIPDIYRAGIEPDVESYEEAKGKIEECFNSPFNEELVQVIENRSPHNRFDCIVFNDVLEHLVDPWHALQLAKRILEVDGVIVASIPNILFYSNIVNMIRTQDFKYENAGIMDITHLRFFSRKSIIRMFEETGYDLLNIEGISSATSLKFELLNILFMNKFADLKYMQFAVVARPSNRMKSPVHKW